MNLLIKDIDYENKNMLNKILTKLEKDGVFFKRENFLNIKIHNNDYNLIFIINNNNLSWTNISYGFNTKYNKFQSTTAEDYIYKG